MTQKGRVVNIPANPKQQLAWAVWRDDLTDDLVYGGYAGGGKTMLAGQVLTGDAIAYPGTKYFLGRKELKTLMQTSYITLTRKVFPQYGLEQDRDWRYDGKYNVVHFKNGSSIDMLDLKSEPSDPVFDRFGSTEYTKGWLEEASEIEFRAYDVLKSRVGRWMNAEYKLKSKLGLGLNPSQDWPYRIFYDPWKKAGKPIDINKRLISLRVELEDGKIVERNFVFIPARSGDNPYTAGEYERNLSTISDPILRARLRDGDWEYSSANDTLFTAATIADIFTNTIVYSDNRYLIVDAARLGTNETVLTAFRGWDAFKIKRFSNTRTPESAREIITFADQNAIPRENILIDEDGVGGGVLDLVPGALGFHGGASPFGKIGEEGNERKENYENLRAQCMYHLANIAKAKKLKVSELNTQTREMLAQDLQQFKRRDSEKDGPLKVIKKEDIKKALGRSPDIGDTFMMRSYFDVREREAINRMGTGIIVNIPDYDV